MIVDWLLVLVGLVLLVGGAEALVRGASGIALLARVPPALVGLTIVAAGTSMPELVVSVQAAAAGSSGLAVGNVVGSNIFNIGAILGIAALVRPLRVVGNAVRFEWPVMMFAAVQLHLLARDGAVDRLEGAFLVAAMVAVILYSIWAARHHSTGADVEAFESVVTASRGHTGPKALAWNLLALGAGVALLAGGSTALVSGAVGLATGFGVSDALVGLTVVAAGTSMPELVTSVVASRRGQDDIAIANILGSNIFNVFGILGVTALILPVPVPAEIVDRDNWVMIGASALLFPLLRSGMKISRVEGALLLGGFLVYLSVLVAGL